MSLLPVALGVLGLLGGSKKSGGGGSDVADYNVEELIKQIPGLAEYLESMKVNTQRGQRWLADIEKDFYENKQPYWQAMQEAEAKKRVEANKPYEIDKSQYTAFFNDPVKASQTKTFMDNAASDLNQITRLKV